MPAFTLMAIVGGLIARGEDHRRVWEVLGTEPAPGEFSAGDLYADPLFFLGRLHVAGYHVGIAGNTPVSTEELFRPHADFVGSSARWGVEKPSPGFFDAILAECQRPASEVAYVGDRVDNDITPALNAGMKAIHIRRGPWGFLQEPPVEARAIASLHELPQVLT